MTRGKPNRWRTPARGHTLIEAMVAGSILIIGLFGTISAIRHTAQAHSHNHHLTAGMHVAEKTMEELLLLPDDSTNLAVGKHTGQAYDTNGRVDAAGAFETSWAVKTGPYVGTKEIVLYVSWRELTRNQTLEFRTYR